MGKKGNYERKDRLYEKAKEDGFRSRATYKLIELNERFHLMRHGSKVLDLGSWPGGWIEVALTKIGSSGKVVGIDLQPLDGFSDPRCKLISADACEESGLNEALQFVGGCFDLVLSDMSPKLTGIREADHAAAIGCAELALWVAERSLRQGGNFVSKVFKSNEAQEFYKAVRLKFEEVKRCELDSTRKTSNEFYIVGLGFKGPG